MIGLFRESYLNKNKGEIAMRLEKCKKGHFYDAEKYASCPHCSAEARENGDQTRTMELDNNAEALARQAFKENERSAEDDQTVWIQMGKNSEGKENPLVVGWLVCVKGENYGKGYPLKAAKNYSGRYPENDVVLSGEKTVSRAKHAVLTYEPKENIFLIQPGESSELVYLNEKVVLTPEILKKNDIISVGEAQLMLIPYCDDQFTW